MHTKQDTVGHTAITQQSAHTWDQLANKRDSGFGFLSFWTSVVFAAMAFRANLNQTE